MITVLQLYLNGLVGTHTYRLLSLPLSMHACTQIQYTHKNLFLQGHVCTDELRPIKAKQLGVQFIDDFLLREQEFGIQLGFEPKTF